MRDRLVTKNGITQIAGLEKKYTRFKTMQGRHKKLRKLRKILDTFLDGCWCDRCKYMLLIKTIRIIKGDD
jgi:hypothetical protein